MTKEMWIGEQERICENFASEEIDAEEATARLLAMGFNANEVAELLREAVA